MELKLIESQPLSQELIDEFYNHLEAQQSDKARVASSKDNKSETEVTRRKFLQYSALGAIALGLSFTTEKAEAGSGGGDDYYMRGRNNNFRVVPELVLVNQNHLSSDESTRGRITITNPTNNYHHSYMELELLSSEDLRYSKSEYMSYSIPPFTTAIFEFMDGPLASAIRDVLVYLQASNQYGSTQSRDLVLFA